MSVSGGGFPALERGDPLPRGGSAPARDLCAGQGGLFEAAEAAACSGPAFGPSPAVRAETRAAVRAARRGASRLRAPPGAWGVRPPRAGHAGHRCARGQQERRRNRARQLRAVSPVTGAGATAPLGIQHGAPGRPAAPGAPRAGLQGSRAPPALSITAPCPVVRQVGKGNSFPRRWCVVRAGGAPAACGERRGVAPRGMARVARRASARVCPCQEAFFAPQVEVQSSGHSSGSGGPSTTSCTGCGRSTARRPTGPENPRSACRSRDRTQPAALRG